MLTDRFVGSNMAHQGGKISDPVQQRGFFVWEDGLEFQLLEIPRPNFNFFLKVPAEVANKLMEQKTRDEHEANPEHLRRTVATYDILSQLFPRDFQTIECTKNGKMLSVAEINDKIWDKLKPLLPQKPPHAAQDLVVRFNESEQMPEPNQNAQEAKSEALELLPDKIINLNISKVSLLAIGQVQANHHIKCQVTSVSWPADGNYSFYTPADLPKNVGEIYKQSMRKLERLHRQMAKSAGNNLNVTQAINATVPLAALASAKISGTAKQLIELIEQMQANQLAEVRWLAAQLASAGRKMHPQQFKNIQTSKQPTLAKTTPEDVIAKLVSEHLPQTLPAHTEEVSLLEIHPRNEFDLLVDSLYPYSSASRAEIAEQLDGWTYQQKSDALLASATAQNGDLLSQAGYLWNVICDSSTFEDLNAVLDLKNIKTQPPTPRYGYNVPKILEETGLDEVFLECFDESLKLFSSLQAANIQTAAAYATLVGHKNRWQFSTSGADFQKPSMPAAPQTRQLYSAMLDKICETHPLLGEFITQENNQQKTQPQPPEPKPTSKLAARSKKRARKSKK